MYTCISRVSRGTRFPHSQSDPPRDKENQRDKERKIKRTSWSVISARRGRSCGISKMQRDKRKSENGRKETGGMAAALAAIANEIKRTRPSGTLDKKSAVRSRSIDRSLLLFDVVESPRRAEGGGKRETGKHAGKYRSRWETRARAGLKHAALVRAIPNRRRCERGLMFARLLATVTSIFRCTEFPPPLSLRRTKRSC